MKYIVAACPALAEFEYDAPVRADQLSEPGRITSQVIKLLIESDLVIADLTANNANVFYELSLRHAIGKPVIHMALEGTRLSFDVQDSRTIFYTMHARTVETAREELANQIRHVHSENYKPTNPILETVGLIKLESSTDPTQKMLGQLVAEMSSIRGAIQQMQQEQQEQNFLGRSLLFTSPTAVAGTSGLTGGVTSGLITNALGGSTIVADPRVFFHRSNPPARADEETPAKIARPSKKAEDESEHKK
jgi:hypothetical protein